MGKQRVHKPRNGGKWSEAEYWGRIRSSLRNIFSRWEPANEALRRAKLPYKLERPTTGKLNQVYECATCHGAFFVKDVRKDHVSPCGPLRSNEDVIRFIETLTSEDPADFQIVCVACHQRKTNEEREARRVAAKLEPEE